MAMCVLNAIGYQIEDLIVSKRQDYCIVWGNIDKRVNTCIHPRISVMRQNLDPLFFTPTLLFLRWPYLHIQPYGADEN